MDGHTHHGRPVEGRPAMHLLYQWCTREVPLHAFPSRRLGAAKIDLQTPGISWTALNDVLEMQYSDSGFEGQAR